MIEKYLAPGQKIEMHLVPQYGSTEQKSDKIHLSQINDLLEGNRIEISMPMEHGKLILLPKHGVYTIVAYTSHGLYQCDARVEDRYKKDNIFLIELQAISEIKRYQRREYYRYTCTMPVFTRRLTEMEINKRIWDVDQEGTEGAVIDISGGGIRFITTEEYELHELILCCFHLPVEEEKYEEYQVMGQVLRISPVVGHKDKLEVRVQFEEVTNKIREEIIQFIFEDERRQRKRGIDH